MNKILNYIANGQGRGLKYISLFIFLVCFLGGGILYSVALKHVESDMNLQRVLTQMPTLEIVNGKLVSPENTYVHIPFEEGFFDGIVIDTQPDTKPDLNFNNGVYITTDKVYLKTTGVSDNVQVFNWSDVGTYSVNRAVLDKMVSGVVMMSVVSIAVILFVILWLGFLLMSIVTGVFFWILGSKIKKGTTMRASALSWMGVVTLNLILLFFGIVTQSIPTLFIAGVILSVILIFMALKHVIDEEPITLSGRPFFDTQAPDNDDEKTVSDVPVRGKIKTKPVKITSKKKVVKVTEKPRREPTKKIKK